MASIDLQRKEEETLRRTLTDFATDYALCDNVLALLNEGQAKLTGSKCRDEATAVQLNLCMRHFNSLRWALELMAKGYLTQSLALLRTALEDWAAAKYLGIRPQEANLFTEIPKQPFQRNREMPGFPKMLRFMGANIGQSASEAWDILCSYSHPRPISLQQTYHQDEKGVWFHAGPCYDPRDFSAGLYVWLPVAQMMFKVVGDLTTKLVGAVDSLWASKVREATDEIAETLDRIRGSATT